MADLIWIFIITLLACHGSRRSTSRRSSSQAQLCSRIWLIQPSSWGDHWERDPPACRLSFWGPSRVLDLCTYDGIFYSRLCGWAPSLLKYLYWPLVWQPAIQRGRRWRRVRYLRSSSYQGLVGLMVNEWCRGKVPRWYRIYLQRRSCCGWFWSYEPIRRIDRAMSTPSILFIDILPSNTSLHQIS